MFNIVVDYQGSIFNYVCSRMDELHFMVFVLETNIKVSKYSVFQFNEPFDLNKQYWKLTKYILKPE